MIPFALVMAEDYDAAMTAIQRARMEPNTSILLTMRRLEEKILPFFAPVNHAS